MKVGDIWYSIDYDSETGRASFDEWHIRCIRKGVAHATLKCDLSWGKLSRRHYDYGWFRNVPALCKCKWRIGGSWTGGLSPTKLQACMDEVKEDDFSWFTDDEALQHRMKKSLNRLLSRTTKAAIVCGDGSVDDRA